MTVAPNRTMVRARTPRGCVICELPEPAGAVTIQKSVGLGGRNLADDVRTVQHLLNGVPAQAGGPVKLLDEDGLVGPKTINAIAAYQRRQLGWSDGRVDPGGPTLRHLIEDNGGGDAVGGQAGGLSNGQPVAASAVRTPQELARIARAAAQVPRVKEALRRALLRLDEAQGFCERADTTMPALRLVGEGAWLVFCKHFKMGFTDRAHGPAAIAKVRNVLRSMKTIFDRGTSVVGGVVWGTAIYDARPAPPAHRDWIAYAYIGGWHLGGRISSGVREDSIYFCEAMDGKEDDKFFHTSIHELAHFVGDQPGQALPIVDQAYTDQPRYDQLTHWQRMTNADTYANYVGELYLGSLRNEEVNGPNVKLLDDPYVGADGSISRGKASGFPPNQRP